MLTLLLSVLFALVSVTFTRRQFVALMRAWHELQQACLHRHEQYEQYQREQIAEQAGSVAADWARRGKRASFREAVQERSGSAG